MFNHVITDEVGVSAQCDLHQAVSLPEQSLDTRKIVATVTADLLAGFLFGWHTFETQANTAS